jgi:NAD(P)H-nitrite reductase large subunit
MPSNEIVCTCAEVSNQEIVFAIKTEKLKTIDEICETVRVGMICGGCRPVIQEIVGNLLESK